MIKNPVKIVAEGLMLHKHFTEYGYEKLMPRKAFLNHIQMILTMMIVLNCFYTVCIFICKFFFICIKYIFVYFVCIKQIFICYSFIKKIYCYIQVFL